MMVRRPVEVDVGDVQADEAPRLLYALAPGAFWSHWHEYGGVPPLNVAPRVDDCPWSRAGGVAFGVFTTKAGLTVTAAGLALSSLEACVESPP